MSQPVEDVEAGGRRAPLDIQTALDVLWLTLFSAGIGWGLWSAVGPWALSFAAVPVFVAVRAADGSISAWRARFGALREVRRAKKAASGASGDESGSP